MKIVFEMIQLSSKNNATVANLRAFLLQRGEANKHRGEIWHGVCVCVLRVCAVWSVSMSLLRHQASLRLYN